MYHSAFILENDLAVSQKPKHRLPHDPEIPFLGMHPRELKILFLQKFVDGCSQWPKFGNSPKGPQLMNG